MDSFHIEPDSLTQFNLVPEHNANFELNSPLKVQVLDASGNLVTDGPDSMLVQCGIIVYNTAVFLLLFDNLECV